MAATIEAGTVIHGTHRECDLILAFANELHRIGAITPFRQEWAGSTVWTSLRSEDPTALETWCEANQEESGHILEDLFERLDSEAPEGFYFSSTEGDGSDFGFWETDGHAFLAAIKDYCEGFPVAIGRPASEFSAGPCGSCGSHLSGHRYAATLMDPKEPIAMEVCVDCAAYHANGELPEVWS